MSEKLNLFREQYPEYVNDSNSKIAYGLWRNEYKDKMPMGIFADSIDLTSDEFGQMVGIAKQDGYDPTSVTGSRFKEGEVPAGARMATAGRGFSLGAAENIASGLAASGEKVKRFFTGEEQRPFDEAFQDYLGLSRDIIRQYQDVKPVESFFMEAVPAVASGVGVERGVAIAAPKVIAAMSPAAKIVAGTRPSIMKTAAASGMAGGVYGFNTGESGERVESAYELAIPSAFFGGGSQVVMNFAAPAIQGIGRSFGRRMENFDTNPTVQSAKLLKNDIYQKATNAGVVYDNKAMRDLYNQAKRLVADEGSYDPSVDDQMRAALTLLKSKSEGVSNLIQLEKIRRALFARYKKSNYADQTIRDLVDLVDDTIQNAGTGDATLIKAARLANGRYKKAELIDAAFDKATRSAEAAGSGGNTVNRYKQVINNILNSKKEMRFFNASEEQAMRDFVEFTNEEQLNRIIGKLDPSSGGLMLALGVGGMLADPVTTGVLALTGAGARRGLEETTRQSGEALVTRMATGSTPRVNPIALPSPLVPQIESRRTQELENIRGEQ